MGGIGKSTFREIKSSFGRFMAIFAIIALGVGFFAGLKVTKEGMVAAVHEYLDVHAFYDYRLLSTLGFEQEDVDTLAAYPDVEAAEGSVSFDIIYRLEDGGQGVAKTYSVTEKLNTLKLVSGRMPRSSSECVADSNYFGQQDIGSIITLSPDNEQEDLDHFTDSEYTIVGIVQSPLYLQYERGNTSLGTGKVDCFLYLAPEGYDTDYFTEIYVRFAQGYELYSREYDDFMDEKEAVWEELTANAAKRRYQDIIEEAEEKLADAQAEFEEKKAEGEAELADAALTLEDARIQLADGEQALADAREELEEAEKTLTEKEQELEDALKAIAENEEKLTDGERTLKEKEAELADGERILAESEAELAEGERQLAEGRAQWNENYGALEAVKQELSMQRSYLDAQAAQLAAGREQLTASAEESALEILAFLPAGLPEEQREMLSGLAAGLSAIAEGTMTADAYIASLEAIPGGNVSPVKELKEGLAAAASELEAAKAELDEGERTLGVYLSQLEEGEAQLAQGEAELKAAGQLLAASEREIEEGRRAVNAARDEIREGRSAIGEARRELEEGREELEKARAQASDGQKALADARKEIEEAQATIAEKEEELEEAEQEYEDGLKEYEEAKQEFDEKIGEAEQEITDARQEIADIEEPDTYVLGRDTNIGYVCFESDSNIVEGIANLFPAFFFLVAALVCITTMNRMVEEQRTQIGVLKALGYSNGAVMSKYMIYSGLAAVMGCIFGFFLGTWGFPRVIWLCYGIMYSADPIFYVFNWKLAVISMAVSMLCSMGTTWLSCRMELSQPSAMLMRPRAPKAGKRVFLEYVPFLWKRLSFLRKVTVRNLFRYKKRLFMMVLGISGCTALLVTGFGIKDSIADVASKQFQEIQTYDISIALKDSADREFREKLEGLKSAGIGDYICVMEKNMDLVTAEGVKAVWLVTGNADEMPSYVDFHTSKEEQIAYPDFGEAVISNKIAEDYNIEIGDTIMLRDENMLTVSVKVAAVYENYIYNYVHISEDTWRSLTGEEPECRTVYMNQQENTKETEDIGSAHRIAAELMKLEQVSNVTVNADTMDRIGNMMASLDIIVVVVILCAAGLAFIVLYNLTNINITERVREIATIKVLGFYKKETNAYVFRENILLTLLGMLFGLVLGYFLHRLVMNQIRVDMIAFDIYVKPLSYLYSVILTIVFTWLVNKTMGGKLEEISMTESLKSVD